MITIPKSHHDKTYLQRQVKEHLSNHTFTPEQETSIRNLILEIASGYQRTIDRMSWGPGWD